jgi:hypothetical protein
LRIISTDLDPERTRQAFALGLIEGESIVIVVVGDIVVEDERALHRHFQARILEHAERRGVGHMRVQYAACACADAMHRQMNIQRRVFDRSAAADDLAVEIDHHEIAGLHLRPMQPEGREQKPVRMSRHHQRQMIVDAFVQSEVRRQPVAGGKIDARRAFGFRLRLYRFEIRVHVIASLQSKFQYRARMYAPHRQNCNISDMAQRACRAAPFHAMFT